MHVVVYTCSRREISPPEERKKEIRWKYEQHSRPTPSERIHPQKERKKKKILGPGCYKPTHIYEHPCCGSQTIKMPSKLQRHASLSHSILMIFFSPLCVPLFLIIFRYFLSLSPTEIICWPAASSSSSHVVWCCVLAERVISNRFYPTSWDDQVFLFSSFSTTTTLIVMDCPDFRFFSVFFSFLPSIIRFNILQVGCCWAVETITCAAGGGPLGIWLHDLLPERRGQYTSSRSVGDQQQIKTTNTKMPSCWKLAWCFCSDPGRRPKISSPVHLLLKVNNNNQFIIIITRWLGWAGLTS